MRRFPTRTLVLIALATPLCACNSFLGINFARHAPRAAPTAASVSALIAKAESMTSVGRRQLADGQTGLAIESFQRAMASGEPIASAVNGLGVAYARLDRFDLAQRYFEQAIASDPANNRYADNLARLMRSSTIAMRRDGDIAKAALQAAARAQAAAKAVNAATAMGKLQRVSRGEVRIASAPPQAAPTATGQAKVDSRFKPLVRVSIVDPMGPFPQSSVRVMLPEAKLAQTETARKAHEASTRR
jgi:tetratricopeptide (TPR) repeat protein